MRIGGTLCMVGALDETSINPRTVLGRNLTVADVEVLPASAAGHAFDRLARNDVEIRFSLDMTGF